VALAEYMRLHPVMRGNQEPYRYEREVEDFLRWSPNVTSAAYRAQARLSPEESDELSRLSAAHAARTGTLGGGSAVQQAEALARAARADEDDRDAAASLTPRAGSNGQEGPDAPSAGGPVGEPDTAGIQRYDDLEPEEVVSLLASMDTDDLFALRDHERSAGARPRILAAIDGVLARREATRAG
jgi:hypothetical protein